MTNIEKLEQAVCKAFNYYEECWALLDNAQTIYVEQLAQLKIAKAELKAASTNEETRTDSNNERGAKTEEA